MHRRPVSLPLRSAFRSPEPCFPIRGLPLSKTTMRHPIAARSQNGSTDLCKSCYQTTDAECVVCHLARPVHTTTWPIGPVCTGCYRRVLRTPNTCPTCDQVKALIGFSETGERICGPCAGATRDYVCATCGAAGDQHFERTCIRCSVTLSVRQLLSSATGTIPVPLTELPPRLHSGAGPTRPCGGCSSPSRKPSCRPSARRPRSPMPASMLAHRGRPDITSGRS